jgi:hypothetical protein
MIFLAAVAVGSSLFAIGPTTAQPQIQLGIGADGRPQLGVRDPERERFERRERRREREEAERARAYEEGRRDAARSSRFGENCRNITIEEEDRRGRIVTRRIRRCD